MGGRVKMAILTPRAMRSVTGDSTNNSTASGSAMLRATLRHGKRPAFLNATPATPALVACAGVWPPISALPASSGSNPSAARNTVDLPQRDGPISAVKLPGGLESVTSHRACMT